MTIFAAFITRAWQSNLPPLGGGRFEGAFVFRDQNLTESPTPLFPVERPGLIRHKSLDHSDKTVGP